MLFFFCCFFPGSGIDISYKLYTKLGLNILCEVSPSKEGDIMHEMLNPIFRGKYFKKYHLELLCIFFNDH